jgi:segregation and condensation protein A
VGTVHPFHFSKPYQISTAVYEGPLDLLLQLIERAELDITRLALAQVTDQFLEHLKFLDNRTADEVSSFLVIAARLLQIKSEALLPRPPAREQGEEDPAEALALQLIAYKRYRQIANLLAQRDETGLRSYLRSAPMPHIDAVLDLTGIGIKDLIITALAAFTLAQQKQTLNSVVSPPRITIREKIQFITNILQKQRQTHFSSLISDKRSRLDVIVTFLALLELIKLNWIKARQENLFSDIALEPVVNWQPDQEIETEFGE